VDYLYNPHGVHYFLDPALAIVQTSGPDD